MGGSLVATLSCGKAPLPTAFFKVTHLEPNDLTVGFEASGSTSRVGSPTAASPGLEYLWNFGDGNSWDCQGCNCADQCRRDIPSVTHPYGQAGRYRVTLTVKDGNSSTDSFTLPKLVHAGNKIPVPCFTVTPAEPKAHDLVQFDGACSSDDGSVVTWEWNVAGVATSGSAPTQTFTEDGSYNVSLVVKDDDGAPSGALGKQIRVVTAPIVTITSPETGATLRGDRVPISVSVNTVVTRVEFYIDDAFADEKTAAPFGTQWNLTGVANGAHKIEADGFNSRNEKSKPSFAYVVVDR